MKQLNGIIASPLVELVNKSFQSGIFLGIFKISKVIPIFKSESRREGMAIFPKFIWNEYSVKNFWYCKDLRSWALSLDIENIDLIAIDENVKTSKRKLISYKDAVEEVLQFVEEGDKNLEDEDDLEELFPQNQVHFQLQPGKTKLL